MNLPLVGAAVASVVVLSLGPTACAGDAPTRAATGPCDLVAAVLPAMAERGLTFEELLRLDPLDDVDGVVPTIARAHARAPQAAQRFEPAIGYLARRAHGPTVDDPGPQPPTPAVVESARDLDRAVREGACDEPTATG